MYVILVYDVESKRDPKVLKACRQYLTWVQNSVFEGEVTEGRFRILMSHLRSIIDRNNDCIVAYTFDSGRYTHREVLGSCKGGEVTVL